MPYLYQWRWLNEETNMFSKNSHRMMHGMVYSREFLNIHNITFGTEMPYSNEDIGFNHTCYLIIQNLVVQGCYPALIEQYDLPIYFLKVQRYEKKTRLTNFASSFWLPHKLRAVAY